MVLPTRVSRFACTLTAFVLGIAGCTEGESPSTGPASTESAIQEFADVIGTVQDEYLDANAPVLRSLEVLTPYLESVLAASPAIVFDGLEFQIPCVSNDLAGRTFVFDGSGYVPGDLSGAPSTGVRFLLYNINAQGRPELETPLGHLEVRCLAGPSGIDLKVGVVASDVEVLGVVVSGSHANPIDLGLSGVEKTPDGRAGWSWGGGLLGSGFFYTAELPGEVSALYTVLDQEGTTPDNVLVQIRKATPELDWEIYADILTGAGGEILEGPVRLTTREGSRLAACMSASIELPAITSPVAGACGSVTLPALSPSPDELRALQSGYVVLRNLYMTAGRLLATGLTALAPPP